MVGIARDPARRSDFRAVGARNAPLTPALLNVEIARQRGDRRPAVVERDADGRGAES